MEQFLRIVLGLAAIWAILFICIGLPSRMAAKRGRNPGHWVLVSLFGTPILAVALLLALDERPADKPGSAPK